MVMDPMGYWTIDGHGSYGGTEPLMVMGHVGY